MTRFLLRDLTPGQLYAMKFRTNDGTNTSAWSPVYKFTTASDVVAPNPVTNLAFYSTGESFVATWTPPVLDGNGQPLVDFKDFEVTVSNVGDTKSRVYYTATPAFEFTLPMNNEVFGGIELSVKISVKSRDLIGNKSSAVAVTASDDAPPTPGPPVVSNAMGLISVEWDGSTALGTITPFNLQYVEIHASTTSNFTPSNSTIVGRFEGWLAGKQKTIVTGLTYGVANYFKFVAVNRKGKKSNSSAQATGTPARISGLDIADNAIGVDQINFAAQLGGGRAWYEDDPPTTGVNDGDTWFDKNDKYHVYVRVAGAWVDARDATIAEAASVATSAQTAANGKNQVTYSATAPSDVTNPGTRAGDIWFVRNAATGVIAAQYEWSGTTWGTPRTLDNAVIANLDAGKLTAGTISAARIGASTITTDKLTVGDLDNLQENPGLEFGTTGWTGTYTVDATKGRTGTRSLRMVSSAAVVDALGTRIKTNGVTEERFYVEGWCQVSNTTTTGTLQLAATAYNASGAITVYPTAQTFASANATTGTWTKISGTIIIPAGSYSWALRLSIRADVAAGLTLWWDDFVVRRQVGSTIIADGAITTTKINAGAVTADSVGTNLIITASANIGNAVIDDAKIANLNAAKIRTGELMAGQRIIAGPTLGTHAELTSTGFRAYRLDPADNSVDEVVRIGTDTDDTISLIDSAGKISAGIDITGVANLSGLNVTGDPRFQGNTLSSLLTRKSEIKAWTMNWANPGATTNEMGMIELSTWTKPYHMYSIQAHGMTPDVAGIDVASVTFSARMTLDGTAPTINSTRIGSDTVTTKSDIYPWDNPQAKIFALHREGATSRLLRVLLTVTNAVGAQHTQIFTDNAYNLRWFTITDLGISPVDTGQVNYGGGTRFTGAPPPPPPVSARVEGESIFDCTWSSSFNGDGTFMSGIGEAYQGYHPSVGNSRSFLGFPDMQPALAGAAIRYVKLWLWYPHWYNGAGGYPVISWHLNFNKMTQPLNQDAEKIYGPLVGRGSGVWIDLPVSWGDKFRDAAARGIALGPGPDNGTQYYGKANGWNQPNFPKLAIGWVK